MARDTTVPPNPASGKRPKPSDSKAPAGEAKPPAGEAKVQAGEAKAQAGSVKAQAAPAKPAPAKPAPAKAAPAKAAPAKAAPATSGEAKAPAAATPGQAPQPNTQQAKTPPGKQPQKPAGAQPQPGKPGEQAADASNPAAASEAPRRAVRQSSGDWLTGGKVLAYFGFAVAGFLFLIFGLDLALAWPFMRASLLMDVVSMISAVILAYLSWDAYRTMI